MRRGSRARRRPSGFTYLGLLVLIALIGLALAAAGEVAATAAQRQREAELLWVGHQYQLAIARYWNRRRTYPQALEELLGVPGDAPVQVRDLRRLYPDPMTGAADWKLVRGPGGGIMGVASSSTRAPIKVARFDQADEAFEDAATYGDWKFTFPPGPARRKADGSPGAPAAGDAAKDGGASPTTPWGRPPGTGPATRPMRPGRGGPVAPPPAPDGP